MLHGGGRKCSIDGCNKSSQGRAGKCVAHGGGRRCAKVLDSGEPCPKVAQGSTAFCVAHGGGKRCTYEGCSKAARPPRLVSCPWCGRRCQMRVSAVPRVPPCTASAMAEASAASTKM